MNHIIKKKGSELEFISWILRDGSGTKPVDKDMVKNLNDTEFTCICLSISQKTYIACEFNLYVVRFK